MKQTIKNFQLLSNLLIALLIAAKKSSTAWKFNFLPLTIALDCHFGRQRDFFQFPTWVVLTQGSLLKLGQYIILGSREWDMYFCREMWQLLMDLDFNNIFTVLGWIIEAFTIFMYTFFFINKNYPNTECRYWYQIS